MDEKVKEIERYVKAMHQVIETGPVPDWYDEHPLQYIEYLLSRIKELEDQVLRMIRGEFKQVCCYCGWESQEGKWEELETHIKECPFHPLGKAEARVKELEEGIETFIEWTTSPEGCNYIKDIPDHIWQSFNNLLPEKE